MSSAPRINTTTLTVKNRGAEQSERSFGAGRVVDAARKMQEGETFQSIVKKMEMTESIQEADVDLDAQNISYMISTVNPLLDSPLLGIGLPAVAQIHSTHFNIEIGFGSTTPNVAIAAFLSEYERRRNDAGSDRWQLELSSYGMPLLKIYVEKSNDGLWYAMLEYDSGYGGEEVSARLRDLEKQLRSADIIFDAVSG